MTGMWPQFITKDLGDTDEDSAEMMRRWTRYDMEMNKLIATGHFHRDEDGWWVETATGELVGPDPEIERPRTDEELGSAKPLREVLPDLAASIDREIAKRGRPRLEKPKAAVTLRLDPDTVAFFKGTGDDWRTRMAETLDSATRQTKSGTPVSRQRKLG